MVLPRTEIKTSDDSALMARPAISLEQPTILPISKPRHLNLHTLRMGDCIGCFDSSMSVRATLPVTSKKARSLTFCVVRTSRFMSSVVATVKIKSDAAVTVL